MAEELDLEAILEQAVEDYLIGIDMGGTEECGDFSNVLAEDAKLLADAMAKASGLAVEVVSYKLSDYDQGADQFIATFVFNIAGEPVTVTGYYTYGFYVENGKILFGISPEGFSIAE